MGLRLVIPRLVANDSSTRTLEPSACCFLKRKIKDRCPDPTICSPRRMALYGVGPVRDGAMRHPCPVCQVPHVSFRGSLSIWTISHAAQGTGGASHWSCRQRSSLALGGTLFPAFMDNVEWQTTRRSPQVYDIQGLETSSYGDWSGSPALMLTRRPNPPHETLRIP